MNNYSFLRTTRDLVLAEFNTKFKSRQSGQIQSDYLHHILLNLRCAVSKLCNIFFPII